MSTEPTHQRLKNTVFLLQILKTAVLFEIFLPGELAPCKPSNQPTQPLKIKLRPPHKSASCATVAYVEAHPEYLTIFYNQGSYNILSLSTTFPPPPNHEVDKLWFRQYISLHLTRNCERWVNTKKNSIKQLNPINSLWTRQINFMWHNWCDCVTVSA